MSFAEKMQAARAAIDARNLLALGGTLDPDWQNTVDIRGKTVRGARHCGDRLVIAFDDGTHVAFAAEACCRRCDEPDDVDADIESDGQPDVYDLRRADAITDEEYAAVKAVLEEEITRKAQKKLDEERATFERLRAKFEGTK